MLSGYNDVPTYQLAQEPLIVYQVAAKLASVNTQHPMTQLSFTSGEIFDIIAALSEQEIAAAKSGDHHLAAYYLNMIQQFELISVKLKELPGEKRVAHLVLAAA